MIKKMLYPLLLVFLLNLTHAYAGALQISPTRLQLNNPSSITTLKLTNKSDETLYLQLETKHWSQSGGKDHYDNTHDILLTPPMIMLAPDESQLVRIALRQPVPQSTEVAYRIFIQEIPAASNDQSVGINFNLRFGIPLFIKNKSTPAFTKEAMAWEIIKKDQDLHIHITNHNAVHVQLTHLLLTAIQSKEHIISESIFYYLLPNQSVDLSYPLKILPNKPLDISIDTDQGPIRAQSK